MKTLLRLISVIIVFLLIIGVISYINEDFKVMGFVNEIISDISEEEITAVTTIDFSEEVIIEPRAETTENYELDITAQNMPPDTLHGKPLYAGAYWVGFYSNDDGSTLESGLQQDLFNPQMFNYLFTIEFLFGGEGFKKSYYNTTAVIMEYERNEPDSQGFVLILVKDLLSSVPLTQAERNIIDTKLLTSSVGVRMTFEGYAISTVLFSQPRNGKISYSLYKLTGMRKRLSLPADPIKEGHTFIGWYTDSACRYPYNGSPIYEDTVLYAGWQINRFSVLFKLLADYELETRIVDWNTVLTDLPSPEWTGYSFSGWYFEGVKYENQAVKQDIVLLADWELIKYKVKFMVDGTEYKTMDVEYGTVLSEIKAQAKAENLNILSIADMSGFVYDEALQDYVIVDDIEVQAELVIILNNIASFVQAKWMTLAIILAIVLVVIWLLPNGKRKRRKTF